MNKKLALVVCALLAFGAANAAVTVKQGNKVVRYANNVTIAIDSTEDTVVNYNGVDVFVPKGTKVTLSPSVNNTVTVIGSDMRGVQVYGLTLNASGRSTTVVNPADRTLSVREGTLQVQNQSGQVATAPAGYVVRADNMITPAAAVQAQNKPQTTAKPNATTAANQEKAAAADATAADNLGMFGDADDIFVNDLVNDAFGENINNQQAVQDVEEEEVLSPSAPY